MKKNKLEQAKARLANKTAGVNFNEFSVMDKADFKQMQEALDKLQATIKEGVNVKLGADISPREQLKDYGLRLSELIGVVRAGITIDNIDKIKIPEPLSKIEVSNLKEIEGYKDFKADFDGLNKALVAINETLKKSSGKNPEDYIPVRIVISPGQRLEFLQNFPIPSFGGGGGGGTGGGGSIDTTGLATDSNQTNGSQKTQVVDAGGEAVTVTGGKLDVNASVDTTGLATSAKQDTIIGHVDGVEGLLTTIDADTGNIVTNSATIAGDTTAIEASTGATSDAAATAGATGTIQAKLRLATSQLDSIKTAVETIDNTVSGSEMQVDVVTMPTTTVQATNLDVRDLAQATDNVRVYANTAKDGSGTGYVPLVDTDGHLQVDVLSGGGASVQYTEGDTDASITGNANMLEKDSNTITVQKDDAGFGENLTEGIASTHSRLWDGTGYDRMPGNSTDGVLVNLGSNNDVTVTSISAGTNQIGDVGVKPRTSGGLTIFRSIDLDESEEEAKATAGQVYGWYIYNSASSVRYVKLYNATAANVTVGTTTPVMTIPIPATSGANVEFTNGIAFSTAITAAATTGVADNDTGAPGANEVIINLLYS